MNKEDILKYFLIFSSISTISQPSFLFSQKKSDLEKRIEQAINEDYNIGKDDELYDKINERMFQALHPEPKGYPLPGQNFRIKISNDYVPIHIKSEYFKGPKGAGPALRVTIYLDKHFWHSKKGIFHAKLILFGTNEMSISKEMYEVNVNRRQKYVTNAPLKYVKLEGDYFPEKTESMVYAILKKAKIKKKDINQIFWAKGILEDIKDYDLQQKIIEKGNEITGQSVYFKVLDYKGYGFFDYKNFVGSIRNPLLLRAEILRGESNIKAMGLILDIADFKPVFVGKEPFLDKTKIAREYHFWNFPLTKIVKHFGYDKLIKNTEEE